MKQVKETQTITVDRWEASDGRRFNDPQACMKYELSLNTMVERVDSIERKTCYFPFTEWDMDVESSELFLLKDENEYTLLADYYSHEWNCDTDYWDEPESYPAVYVVIARECFAAGRAIDWDTIDEFTKVIQSMNEYLCKKEQLKNQ